MQKQDYRHPLNKLPYFLCNWLVNLKILPENFILTYKWIFLFGKKLVFRSRDIQIFLFLANRKTSKLLKSPLGHSQNDT